MGYQSMPPPMGRPDSRGTMPPTPKLVSCWCRRPAHSPRSSTGRHAGLLARPGMLAPL